MFFFKKTEPTKYVFLSVEENAALGSDYQLEDFVSRIVQYFRFDEELGIAFAKTCAGAAEFLQRQGEVKKRSVPVLFRGFTSTMVRRIREMRRAIRSQMPSMLEEFDELKTEVETYEKDSHHNMWCDAHLD